MKKFALIIFLGLFLAPFAFASCNGYDYSLSYFGYKLDASGTYRLNICGSWSYLGTLPDPTMKLYNYILWEGVVDNLSANYCSASAPGSTYDGTLNYIGYISLQGQSPVKYQLPWLADMGSLNSVACNIISGIKCNGSWSYKSSGFSVSDIQSCFSRSLTGFDTLSVNYLQFQGGSPSNPSAYFSPNEILNFQDTEIAPVLSYSSPLSSATTTFSSTSAPFFFSGSVSYSSAVHNFNKICLQYSTTSGAFNDINICCSSILSQNVPFSITCTPSVSSTYFYRYKLQGLSKGQFAEYVFPQAANPFILNGDPSSWAVSQNPEFASTTAKVDCSSEVLITDIFLCEIKNLIIDVFIPTQDGTQSFKVQSEALIKKFPFNYITELRGFFEYLANYSYSSASPTWSVKGLPYTPSTSTRSVQPFNSIPTSSVSLLGNKTPIEGVRFMTKLAMLLIFVQVCYLTFARFVLNTPE